MKKNWTEEELIEHFTLLPNERHLVMGNKTEVNRLGFAVLVKYFQQEANFPNKKQDISKIVLDYIAKQLDLSPDLFDQYSWGGKEKTYTRHRQSIRNLFDFREWTKEDKNRYEAWLKEQVQFTHDIDYLKSQSYSLFREWKTEPPLCVVHPKS